MKPHMSGICVAALLAGLAVLWSSESARALSFSNCTGERLQIHVLRWWAQLPTPDHVVMLDRDGRHRFAITRGLLRVRVYSLQSADGAPVIDLPDMIGAHEFSVRKRSHDAYFLSRETDCANADAPPLAKTLASVPVHDGIWTSVNKTDGRYNSVTISNFDGTTFTVRSAPGGPASTYTLVLPDTYRDPDGNSFTLTARFKALWNGVPYRYNWLE